MTPRWLTRFIRRRVTSPTVYGLMRTAMLAIQRVTRRADEPDLWFLARLPARDDELILDVGANGGQSAVALSFIRPRAQILSYEPLPTLWPELERLQGFLRSRFAFRKYALGRTPGAFSLYVPVVGKLPITTRASISKAAAFKSCEDLETSIGVRSRVSELSVEVRVGDAEALKPAAIKIDVEGAEFEVVQGFAKTIERFRPLVILERSESFGACAAFFRQAGYDILTHEADVLDRRHLPGLSGRNWIACPTELTATVLKAPSRKR